MCKAQHENATRINVPFAVVDYIYNKAYDIALKDERISWLAGPYPIWVDFGYPDSVRFIISTKLERNIDPRYVWRDSDIDRLSSSNELNIQEQFDEVNFRNFGRIYREYMPFKMNWDSVCREQDWIHNWGVVWFSDLYESDEFIYLAMTIRYFIKSIEVTLPTVVVFEIEMCNDRVPMFRRAFNVNLTYSDPEYKMVTPVWEFFEKPCRL